MGHSCIFFAPLFERVSIIYYFVILTAAIIISNVQNYVAVNDDSDAAPLAIAMN